MRFVRRLEMYLVLLRSEEQESRRISFGVAAFFVDVSLCCSVLVMTKEYSVDFLELTQEGNKDTGAVEISIRVADAVVRNQLAEFYKVVAPHRGLSVNTPWNAVDEAAERAMGVDRYRELRRDFVVNRIVGEALSRLNIVPSLTPRIHVLDYPSADSDYAFELSVVERPKLSLSSCEPVEIEVEDFEVTDAVVDARVSQLLEMRAEYTEAPDHPVALGDCIKVDIATASEGKTVPHLTGKGFVLDLSDGSMPASFVNGLAGAEVGETRSFEYEVKRPRAIVDTDVDRYSTTVTVLAQLSKTVPVLDDAWVSANIEGNATVDDFKNDVRRSLEIEATHMNRDAHARLANIELEKRLVGTIPDAFYQASRNGLMDKLERELAEKGQTIDDYYEQERMNEEELSVQMLVKSAENLRQGFALEALFDGRDMQLSPDDLREACRHAFGTESFDKEEYERTGKYRLVESAAKRMVALRWLVDTAIVKTKES